MKRLSSSLTVWWYKRCGPVLLGATLLVGAVFLSISVARGTVGLPWLAAPVILALLVWVYLRRWVFPLADEVCDAGHELLVRRGRHTTRLALRDIASVDYSLIFDPPRITMRVAVPGGAESVAFMPRLFVGMCFFRRHPLVDNLRGRMSGSTPGDT